MYRYRLIDEDTGQDLGPLVSLRLTYAPGEKISRDSDERFSVIRMVDPETETFRAYLIVRRL